MVNNIFFQAVQGRASDIHIEPYETSARVRFRVDGVLHDILCIPKDQVSAVFGPPQDHGQPGHRRTTIASRRTEPRTHRRQAGGRACPRWCPPPGANAIVLRLLNKGRGQLTLQEIGFEPDMLTVFRNLIHVPHGIILLTGPTGSGKTTTLYAALNELNCEELNILTVEDPVEYQLPRYRSDAGQAQDRPDLRQLPASHPQTGPGHRHDR